MIHIFHVFKRRQGKIQRRLSFQSLQVSTVEPKMFLKNREKSVRINCGDHPILETLGFMRKKQKKTHAFYKTFEMGPIVVMCKMRPLVLMGKMLEMGLPVLVVLMDNGQNGGDGSDCING